MKIGFIYFVIFSLLSQIIYAQENITLELVKRTEKNESHAVNKQKSTFKLFPIIDYYDSVIATKVAMYRTDGEYKRKKIFEKKSKLTLDNGKTLEVFADGETCMCKKANVIVDYEEDFYSGKNAYSLFFYDLQGNLLKEYPVKHKYAKVRMSDNGYTVVSGVIPNSNPINGIITLYDNKGKEIFCKNTGNLTVREIEISKNGNYIFYTCNVSPYNPITNKYYNIVINNKAEQLFSFESSFTPYIIEFSENEKFVAFNIKKNTYLFDINKGKMLWTKNSNLSLNRSFGFIDNYNLLIILTETKNRLGFNLIDITSGNEFAKIEIPDLQTDEFYRSSLRITKQKDIFVNSKGYIYRYRLVKK